MGLSLAKSIMKKASEAGTKEKKPELDPFEIASSELLRAIKDGDEKSFSKALKACMLVTNTEDTEEDTDVSDEA